MTDINETKLTAYALGELDAAERAEVEAYLNDSTDAQQAVAEVHRIGELIGERLAAESAPTLTDRQRRTIERAVRAGRPSHWATRAIAIAAMLLLSVGVTVSVMTYLNSHSHEPVVVRGVPPVFATIPPGYLASTYVVDSDGDRPDLRGAPESWKYYIDYAGGGATDPWLSGLGDVGTHDDIDDIYKDAHLVNSSAIDTYGRAYLASVRVVDTSGLASVNIGGELGPERYKPVEFDLKGLLGGYSGLHALLIDRHEGGATTGRKGREDLGSLGYKNKSDVASTGYSRVAAEVLLTTASVSSDIPKGGARTGGADRGGEGSGRTPTGQTVEATEKISATGGSSVGESVESDRGARRAGTVDPRKVIYTATMRIATTEAELAVSQTRQLTEALGGYMQQMTKSAIIIRVPVTSFDAVLAQLAEMGTVVEQQIFGHDVTEEYVDLEIRLKTAKAMLTKLVELLGKATDVEKALMVEREIGRVQLAIDRIEGRLKLLANRTAYATITVNFVPAQHVPTTMKVRLPFSWLGELGVENLMKF